MRNATPVIMALFGHALYLSFYLVYASTSPISAAAFTDLCDGYLGSILR